MAVQIIPYDRSYAKEVQNIIHRGLMEVEVVCYTPEIMEQVAAGYTLERIEEINDTCIFLLAQDLDTKEIVGCGALQKNSDTECEFLAIFTLPESLRQGIGTKIMHELENTELFINSQRRVVPASAYGVPFYQALGYKLDENLEHPTEEGLYILIK